MKNLKFLPLVCAFLVCATVAASAGNDGKVLLIVETDMGNDIDDAIALDVLYKYADAGMVNIVAIGNHKYSPTATAVSVAFFFLSASGSVSRFFSSKSSNSSLTSPIEPMTF